MVLSDYQLDLLIPGNCPACAISRRQMRHSPNLRYTDRGRPHRWQRVYPRTLNFGCFAALAISDFLAMAHCSLNGKPSLRSNSRPSSSLVAVVTTVTFIPRVRSIESGLISWNIDCSVSPNV